VGIDTLGQIDPRGGFTTSPKNLAQFSKYHRLKFDKGKKKGKLKKGCFFKIADSTERFLDNLYYKSLKNNSNKQIHKIHDFIPFLFF